MAREGVSTIVKESDDITYPKQALEAAPTKPVYGDKKIKNSIALQETKPK